MTEAEWHRAADTLPLLDHIRPVVSDRKLRLYAVACCRRLPLPSAAPILDAAEEMTEGRPTTAVTTPRGTGGADRDAWSAVRRSIGRSAWAAARGSTYAACSAARGCPGFGGRVPSPRSILAIGRERAEQARLVRDIFGNPFRPVAIDPSWQTSTVVALAEGIYADRAFDRLPILADALEDAGCDEPSILDHCRGPGPHVRGCWVVDLILGKE